MPEDLPAPLGDDIEDVLRDIILPEFTAAKEDLRILLQEARKKHRRALNALKRRQVPQAQVEALKTQQEAEIRELQEEFEAWVRATIEQERKGA
jgi:hypothetical protein